MTILSQFVLRLVFGTSLAMACTPSKLVAGGYYRNNLYILLGLNSLAVLVAWAVPGEGPPLWPPLVAAVASYVGAICWLYEKPWPGTAALVLIAATTLAGAWLSGAPGASAPLMLRALAVLDPLVGGLVLGLTFAAMLLGHWYLNAPGMALAPLKRLVLAMFAAVVVRSALAALGLGLELTDVGFDRGRWLFVALRWLAGLFGAGGVAVATWQTLKIPNTQSATGILYVGVIGTFLGELMSQLLSSETTYPL
ncbi:MAG TPA: hypothetical protein VMV69_03400 [Pirellulales bacterium]|nr:hypothetical protein [Pirellulales bacterium]